MKSLILAGGFATRLYPLTINKAKALLPYKGKPIINHIIERIPGDIEILVSTNKKFEADFLDWKAGVKRQVEILIEEAQSDDQKKGAVGAVHYWIKNKNVQEDLIVIASDNYFDLDLTDMLKKYNGRNAMIAVYDVGDKQKACETGRACQVGLVTLEKNRVIRLDEKPPEATSSVIATGIYILPSRIFPLLEKHCDEKKCDNLGSFISYLLNHDEVQAYIFNGTWMDIGDEILRGRIQVDR